MKKPSRKSLIDKLDKIFSIYIRRKDAVNDIATCVTCGKKDHWTNYKTDILCHVGITVQGGMKITATFNVQDVMYLEQVKYIYIINTFV